MHILDESLEDHVGRGPGGKPRWVRLLATSLYAEVHLRWVDEPLLMELYEATLTLLGDRLVYLHHHRKANASRFRDREAAVAVFPANLQSTKWSWVQLADVGGPGSAQQMGGVAQASFEAHLRPATYGVEAAEAQVAQLRQIIDVVGGDMPHSGLPLSRVYLRFPAECFATSEDFRDWLLARPLLSDGRFFSGAAGVAAHLDHHFAHPVAKARLAALLAEHPGLACDIPRGSGLLGRMLAPDGRDLLPLIKRPDWLTFVSAEGLRWLETPTDTPWMTHELAHGVCLQQGAGPVARGPELAPRHTLGHTLAPLRMPLHARDRYHDVDQATGDAWLNHFWPA